ncbi:MAG: AAA family ATPase [Chloroflexota bacterium]
MIAELSVDKYRKYCDPKSLGFISSEEIVVTQTIIGQERAVRALRFGMGIKEKGFNIYVSGQPGTGRTTAIKRFLEEIANLESVPSDWCYVNNFRDNYHPKVLQLPAGKAEEFGNDMNSLIAEIKHELQHLFESEEYANRIDQLVSGFQNQKEVILTQLNQHAQQEGFAIRPTSMGLVIIPIEKGKPLSEEKLLALSSSEKEALQKKQQQLQSKVEAALRQSRQIDQSAQEALSKDENEVALNAIQHLFDSQKIKYKDLPEVLIHLDHVLSNILTHLDDFHPKAEEQPEIPALSSRVKEPVEKRYQVNVITDNSDQRGAPVILEPNPTYYNLFGRIEQEARFGTLVTDFTLIRGGSLHKANGGYIVLPINDLIRNPLVWESLKRALSNDELQIEDVSEKISFATTKSLRPQPIPLNIKVILVGKPEIYRTLLTLDEHFYELFKVKADFDTQMPRNEENTLNYARFVAHLCMVEDIFHLDANALARIVEHGSRLADDQEKLSTRFGEISDVVREAYYYAQLENSSKISVGHIRKAIDEHYYRSSLYQDRIIEMITNGIIEIDISGEQTGQVNGLSVLDLGDLEIGKPNRITASIGLGRTGVMDIEREAEMGGPTHTKGVLILAGFLADKFAQEKPLSLNARLVFEQSYSGVDGDSASSTELYAILSALSGLPIKQGMAVTGSVDQKGRVQAIGGVNYKVEGYFNVCKAIGLTGEQGVLIPESNLSNLMLKEEVLDAARIGLFHIWPIRCIEEGIELLTGIPAGQLQPDGSYPQDTVFYKVDQRLKVLADTLVKYK